MIKRVLVYTYGDLSHAAAIKMAAIAAAKYKAQISCLFVRQENIGYQSLYGISALDLTQNFYQLQDQYAERARAQFEEITSAYDCRAQWHQIEQYERHPKPSLYADLIFVSQPSTESNEAFNDTDFIDRLITETGLPIVMVPRNWAAEDFAQLPILGWKETREAVSAVRHSLPIMRDAELTHVVTVNRQTDLDDEFLQGIGISEYLTEHGVNCEYFNEHMKDKDQSEYQTLIRHVSDYLGDLIIIGGYGHSRFRQIVLGGMTRSLIKNSTVPVLMAH